MTALPPQERERLEALERSLWKAATRYDREYMERVLAADVLEFGRSGATYTRSDVLAPAPAERQLELDAVLHNLEVHALSPGVALVTYRSELRHGNDPAPANRGSIWIAANGDWQLRFHQGTPTTPQAAAAATPPKLETPQRHPTGAARPRPTPNGTATARRPAAKESHRQPKAAEETPKPRGRIAKPAKPPLTGSDNPSPWSPRRQPKAAEETPRDLSRD